MSLQTASFCELNETAVCIWKLLEEKLDRHEITRQLSQKFNASQSQLEEDFDAFIRQLLAYGFLLNNVK